MNLLTALFRRTLATYKTFMLEMLALIFCIWGFTQSDSLIQTIRKAAQSISLTKTNSIQHSVNWRYLYLQVWLLHESNNKWMTNEFIIILISCDDCEISQSASLSVYSAVFLITYPQLSIRNLQPDLASLLFFMVTILMTGFLASHDSLKAVVSAFLPRYEENVLDQSPFESL